MEKMKEKKRQVLNLMTTPWRKAVAERWQALLTLILQKVNKNTFQENFLHWVWRQPTQWRCRRRNPPAWGRSAWISKRIRLNLRRSVCSPLISALSGLRSTKIFNLVVQVVQLDNMATAAQSILETGTWLKSPFFVGVLEDAVVCGMKARPISAVISLVMKGKVWCRLTNLQSGWKRPQTETQLRCDHHIRGTAGGA